MEPRKLLFFDIDGTIMNSADHTIPQSTVEAFQKAHGRGHLIFINTGRPYRHVHPAVRALPIDGYVCALGGNVFCQGETIFRHSFTPEESREIYEFGVQCGIYMLLESEDGVFCPPTCQSPHGIAEYSWLRSIGVPGSADAPAPDFSFDKFVCWTAPDGDREVFRAGLADRLDFIDRENGMLEAVGKGISKSRGMQLLLDRLGQNRRDTYAFGDGPNDLSMLRLAGTSVLMGNAPGFLWPEADFVTDPIDRDGLSKAMLRLGLIGE